MKTLTTIFLICICSFCNAQFLDKLGDRAVKAVERTVERRVEKETTKSTDRVLDTIVDAPKKSKKERRRNRKNKQKSGNVIGGDTDPSNGNANETHQNNTTVNSNFDFEPGTTVIFEDNFNHDNSGDFPSKWDTNGSGEIVSVNSEKWFRLANSSMFIPMTSQNLPDNYTIEFDLLTTGIDNKTSSQARINLLLTDNGKYDKGKNWSMVELSPCQFIGNIGALEKVVNGKREMRNQVGKDYRNTINGQSRISIAVNKTRMRVWMNDNKIIDVPRLVPEGISNFKIETKGLRDDRSLDEIHIKNFRIAKTGQDNRSKLVTEGRLSTNAILFNTGSATIKGGSDAILREVGEAMQSISDMRIMIVGHTDTDGDASSNLKLSDERAKAVREALVNQYSISIGRIQTNGKGETQPVADNNTTSGKEQNRRVEFIKL